VDNKPWMNSPVCRACVYQQLSHSYDKILKNWPCELDNHPDTCKVFQLEIFERWGWYLEKTWKVTTFMKRYINKTKQKDVLINE